MLCLAIDAINMAHMHTHTHTYTFYDMIGYTYTSKEKADKTLFFYFWERSIADCGQNRKDKEMIHAKVGRQEETKYTFIYSPFFYNKP